MARKHLDGDIVRIQIDLDDEWVDEVPFAARYGMSVSNCRHILGRLYVADVVARNARGEWTTRRDGMCRCGQPADVGGKLCTKCDDW